MYVPSLCENVGVSLALKASFQQRLFEEFFLDEFHALALREGGGVARSVWVWM